VPAAPARRAAEQPRSGVISERALRIVAQGRKSSLFVGPGTCGTSLAVLLSVLRTCELLGVNPYDYLLDVLPKLAPLIDRKDTDDDARAEFDELTPASWARRHAAT
jgi:transposase